ncbi:MAG TPA: glycosyltransferase family 39 protein, partial [Candidatus Binataceae bacterium]|nr:glycosyltransferase family 39 protein [Candidatus Binataceae bacterium]
SAGLSTAALLFLIVASFGGRHTSDSTAKRVSRSRLWAASAAPRMVVGCALALHVGLLAYSASCHSPTLNEPGALVSGISHWKFGRFDLFRENPPLVRMIAALPSMAAGFKEDWGGFSPVPELRPALTMGQRFAAANGERVLWLTTLGRWACIPFSLIGAMVCFRWARELYGPRAGLGALLLWCFSPNILAHGALLTSDIGATALGAAAWYAFWRWLRDATWRRAAIFGLLLGIAELAKATLVVFYPLAAVIWVVFRLADGQAREPRMLAREVGMLSLAIAISIYLINLGYGFEGTGRPLGRFDFISATLAGEKDALGRGNRFRGTSIEALPVPLPANYVQGIDVQRKDLERFGLPSYLGGELREVGWWYYYLYGLAVKVPVGTWLIVALAATARFIRGARGNWRDGVTLLAPLFAVLTLASSQTGLNHHFRYILPIAPYAFIWGSAALASGAPVVRALSVVAVASTIASSLYVYPHNLSYFNEPAGGPARGHAHLIHSSLDWGQDLLHLKKWIAEHPEARPLNLVYYGPIDPASIGMEYEFPEFQRSPEHPYHSKLAIKRGWYAVSVNFLCGAPFRAAGSERRRECLRQDACTELAAYTPVGRAGYSIYIYHITGAEVDNAH